MSERRAGQASGQHRAQAAGAVHMGDDHAAEPESRDNIADILRTNLNAATASNGYVANRLTDAQTQQASLDTLYKRFTSDVQDTNMAEAATRLSLNQTQL